MLQHRERLVEVLEDPHHRVVLLHVLLRLAHRDLSVETPVIKKAWLVCTVTSG